MFLVFFPKKYKPSVLKILIFIHNFQIIIKKKLRKRFHNLLNNKYFFPITPYSRKLSGALKQRNPKGKKYFFEYLYTSKH